MNNQEVFIHPLSESQVIIDDKGQKQDVANTWAIASIFWGAYLAGNNNATSAIDEVFQNDREELDRLTKMSLSENGEDVESANLQAINKINFKLEEKIEAAFKDG